MRVISVMMSILLLASCQIERKEQSTDHSQSSIAVTNSKSIDKKRVNSDSAKASAINHETALRKGQSKTDSTLMLTEENAIPFFFEYEKTLTEKNVRFETSMGSFTVRLFQDVPYHRANLVYLAKRGYFEGTQFHRVVKDFIIQGGNTDNRKIAQKRADIGRYLLPPDTDKNHKHHRGVISMPSSDTDNPHKLASPYEFFIVVAKPGSYHLDGNYTAFGEVIEGIDVVDSINGVAVDQGDWPMQNVYILKAEAF
ncbi:MAG: peptidylprolyl isomerase [Bacteroidetes bacterium]|jgi:Peptidyl-prolyl cis-trans isomerase (rotamase) - cyclophilin family|nr:peptidylprolyl isomerase [Bacteroidota bacterium]